MILLTAKLAEAREQELLDEGREKQGWKEIHRSKQQLSVLAFQAQFRLFTVFILLPSYSYDISQRHSLLILFLFH